MDDIPEVEAEPVRSRMDLNAIATIGAVILSVVAICISLLEVHTLRAQQRVSVWPYLQIEQRYNSEGFQMRLTNKGVGPALVSDVELLLDGEPMELDPLILALVGEENAFSYEFYNASDPSNSVMSAREEVRLFRVTWDDRTRLLAERWQGRVDIAVCYCSIHDDCWRAKFSQSQPDDVKTCK